MLESKRTFKSIGFESQGNSPPSAPCIMLIFGASGDLTKRLLVPALYNLACDGLLCDNFAVIGAASSEMDTAEFRRRMSSDEDGIRQFHTRKVFDEAVWDKLLSRMHYQVTRFDQVEDFVRLRDKVAELDKTMHTEGNLLLYFATAPGFFGTLCENLHHAGFKQGKGWQRIIMEKPFGSDLASARKLNQDVLKHWSEKQIYRVDHYLGKETVQNLLAFRFSNGMFEPLWNKNFIDNIQFNVSEEVDVAGRGGYYDSSGVLRDMMQNHMFQMLSYLCMEPPSSFASDPIRDEKAKLLSSVRVYKTQEVAENFVRGQYGPSYDDSGTIVKPGYRQAANVALQSATETYAAGKFFIDNWRWEGVPIYLRSGKALWKRGTEIMVEFKQAPQAIFSGTTVNHLASNRLIFHIQPYQGIELRFQAKVPGPALMLQEVDMRFSYGDAFKASRYTGYEVMLYSCTYGDATLFSRGDLVEIAWKIAQPILDYWKSIPPTDFPNYARGAWGPKSANDLIKGDGRSWVEVVTPDVLERSPLFKGSDPLLLHTVIMALQASTAEAGDIIIRKGDMAQEMYLICRGEVEVLDDDGQLIETLKDGDFFGEIGLLISTPRTATVRAKALSDLFVLKKSDFNHILLDHPQFAEAITRVALERYDLTLPKDQLMTNH